MRFQVLIATPFMKVKYSGMLWYFNKDMCGTLGTELLGNQECYVCC